jgi:hypothetical protein
MEQQHHGLLLLPRLSLNSEREKYDGRSPYFFPFFFDYFLGIFFLCVLFLPIRPSIRPSVRLPFFLFCLSKTKGFATGCRTFYFSEGGSTNEPKLQQQKTLNG